MTTTYCFNVTYNIDLRNRLFQERNFGKSQQFCIKFTQQKSWSRIFRRHTINRPCIHAEGSSYPIIKNLNIKHL